MHCLFCINVLFSNHRLCLEKYRVSQGLRIFSPVLVLFGRLIRLETLLDIASLHLGGSASHLEQKNVALSLVSCKGHQISSGVLPGLAGPNLKVYFLHNI